MSEQKQKQIEVEHEYHTWNLVAKVAEEKGYFEEEGVDPDLDYFDPGIQDFEGGENANETEWWEQMDDGAHGVCEWNAIDEASRADGTILGKYSEWDRVIFARSDSDIETLEDLKGRSVGINNYATSFYSLREMFEDEGFDDDEINLEHIGSPQERFEAVKEGEVDAIGVLEPFVTLGRYDEDLKEVYDTPCRAAIVTTETPDEEAVQSFFRALNKAVKEINENPEEYREDYIEMIEESAEGDEAFRDVNFDELRQNLELREFIEVDTPDEERIDKTADWMQKHGWIEEEPEVLDE